MSVGQLNIGCCNCGSGGGGGGPCSSGVITVTVKQGCDFTGTGGTDAPISGASVTVTETFSPFSVFTGATDSSGQFVATGLPPGTYTVSATYDGATSSATVTIDNMCDPIHVVLTLSNRIMGVSVVGCAGLDAPPACSAALAGVSITIVQSGVTVGTGTTDSTGHVNIALSSPSSGTNYTITYSKPAYFHDVIQTAPGTICFASAIMNSGKVNVGTSTGGGVVDGYACCWGDIPFPATLHATVPGFGAVTLSLVVGHGYWQACVTKTVTGLPTFSCSPGPPTSINTAFFITWTCGTLGVGTSVCPSGIYSGLARTITCADLAAVNSSVGSVQDSGTSCDPLFSFGSFPGGTVIGGVNVSGSWTVIQ